MALLRTNLGNAAMRLAAIRNEVDQDKPYLGEDWQDLPMAQVAADRFSITLPLLTPGHFEAKACFLPAGSDTPVWPAGGNLVINVAPAGTACANTIYNAFVRQFGPYCTGERRDENLSDSIGRLDDAGYTVIPPSGTFHDLMGHLDFILDTLGCRWIQLMPPFPVPTVYARMGRFGCPYAALSFTQVDPGLCVFDPARTPVEQFLQLTDAIHARNGKVLLDIALNHTGWAAAIHQDHPEWLVREEDGTIVVPGAWGVQWEDLTKLDYTHRDLWQYMADVLLLWCERGADGFRLDAGYMIPETAWTYIIARVREVCPDTVFLLEGLGETVDATLRLLNRPNMDWAYSELFQTHEPEQIASYLRFTDTIRQERGVFHHFAETHDNHRLAAISPDWAAMRLALCALFSHGGGFGFANGVEWLATQNIRVHGASSLSWGATPNVVPFVARLTELLCHSPHFALDASLQILSTNAHVITAIRTTPRAEYPLLIAGNLCLETHATACFSRQETGLAPLLFHDLLTNSAAKTEKTESGFSIVLPPGTFCCLIPRTEAETEAPPRLSCGEPFRLREQRALQKACALRVHFQGFGHIEAPDTGWGRHLLSDPAGFCRLMNPESDADRTIFWRFPEDLRRVVPVPAGHIVILAMAAPFSCRFIDPAEGIRSETALRTDDGRHLLLFIPQEVAEPTKIRMKMALFHKESPSRISAELLLLPDAPPAYPDLFRRARTICQTDLICTASLSGHLLRAPMAFSHLESRYDALLAVNPSPDHPADRLVLFTRCRIWIRFRGFSQECCQNSLISCTPMPGSGGIWRFHLPVGNGLSIQMDLMMRLHPTASAMEMTFSRGSAVAMENGLPDTVPVDLILCPDLEYRNAHHLTDAESSPGRSFAGAVTPLPRGCRFHPGSAVPLHLEADAGEFRKEPTWQRAVPLPGETLRGQADRNDLFSPGHFLIPLSGKQTVRLKACATPPHPRQTPVVFPETDPAQPLPLFALLETAMEQFLALRNKGTTVLAGFPWFLDWGRDAMIFARGLIAAGRTEAALSVVCTMAGMEEAGTLPNVMGGGNAANRDTSDAPLWLFVVCRELQQAGVTGLWEKDCNGRPLLAVLRSIGRHYTTGPPNGIGMDPATGLIFSPAHFSWMDTQYPAGTPREGYPIEIQALWYSALTLLQETDPDPAAPWGDLAENVARAVASFFLHPKGGLHDVLFAARGTPAARATPDSAIRPNQLLAVTLGLVSDPALCRSVVAQCQELLVPGGIRSLSDRPVSPPLPVVHDGRCLNDPHHPYQGHYTGEEDFSRKPAYHNGTAWTWCYPVFCEAWRIAYGPAENRTAFSLLSAAIPLLLSGAACQMPEILDGDAPHTPRGCEAQAWSVSELYRVLRLLSPRQ